MAGSEACPVPLRDQPTGRLRRRRRAQRRDPPRRLRRRRRLDGRPPLPHLPGGDTHLRLSAIGYWLLASKDNWELTVFLTPSVSRPSQLAVLPPCRLLLDSSSQETVSCTSIPFARWAPSPIGQ